jgi:hypothetical protein
MALHPKSKIVALRALLAVLKEEEQRLLTTINSDQDSAEEMSKALTDLYKLWSMTLLKVADIEDATVSSESSLFTPTLQSEADCRIGGIVESEGPGSKPAKGPVTILQIRIRD